MSKAAAEAPSPKHANRQTPASNEGLLTPIDADQPALDEALQISVATVDVGFEWDTIDEVWEKVREEEGELCAAYEIAPKNAAGLVDFEANPALARDVELELGDTLFAIVNIARRMGIDPESALHATNAKFRRRWEMMEEAAHAAGSSVEQATTEELERLWQEAKRSER